jgi:hypothetical protein
VEVVNHFSSSAADVLPAPTGPTGADDAGRGITVT